jgi:hypothetical protein
MAKLDRFYVLKVGGCQQRGFVGRYVTLEGIAVFLIIVHFTFVTLLVNPIVKKGNFLHECHILA